MKINLQSQTFQELVTGAGHYPSTVMAAQHDTDFTRRSVPICQVLHFIVLLLPMSYMTGSGFAQPAPHKWLISNDP